MELQFGYNEHSTREFLPKYGGIDWHQLWLQKHNNEDTWSIWAETVDALGQFCEQMHQVNCAFYINATDPDFDTLVVVDGRDKSGDWWFTRAVLGNEEFQNLYDKLKDEVMVVTTRYPMQKAVEYVLKVLEVDIETIESFPDEWDG